MLERAVFSLPRFDERSVAGVLLHRVNKGRLLAPCLAPSLHSDDSSSHCEVYSEAQLHSLLGHGTGSLKNGREVQLRKCVRRIRGRD